MAQSSPTSSAAAAARIAMMRLWAMINAKDIEVTKRWSIFMGGLIALFTLLNFTAWLTRNMAKTSPTLTTIVKFPSRVARPFLITKVPVFETAGHLITILVYWMVLIILSFTCTPNMPVDSSKNWFPKRLGWITLLNIVATVVLSVKNTPLAFLTGYSHERLNILHRTAGFTTVVCWMLHFFLYIGYYEKEHAFYPSMTVKEQIHGYVAGFSLLITALFALRPFRQRFYEFFYRIHNVMYILILINVGLHKPEVTRRVCWVLVFAGGVIVASRTVRFLQLLWNSIGNRATVIPLDGATKIIMDRKLRCKPGDHIFITLPAIRFFEGHPFTISDTKNTELCVRRRNGFTAALNDYAIKNPGAKLRVLIEGPFGNIPDYTDFDQVILVAGGVGITFCISIALDIVRSKKWNKDKKAQLHWMVKSETHMDWFEDELKEIQNSDRIELTCYITRVDGIRQNALPESPVYPYDEEKKMPPLRISRVPSYRREEGKPDIKPVIENAVKTAKKTDSIIVSACGPGPLMDEVRSTVARSITLSGPSVTLRNETFGW